MSAWAPHPLLLPRTSAALLHAGEQCQPQRAPEFTGMALEFTGMTPTGTTLVLVLGTTHTWKSVHQCHVGTQGHTASSGSVSPCTAGPGCCCTSPDLDATAMAPRRSGEWEGRDLSFTGWIDIQQKIFPYFTQMDPKPRVF